MQLEPALSAYGGGRQSVYFVACVVYLVVIYLIYPRASNLRSKQEMGGERLVTGEELRGLEGYLPRRIQYYLLSEAHMAQAV